MFDNGLMRKDPSLQEAIAKELSRQNMELGPDYSEMVARWEELPF